MESHISLTIKNTTNRSISFIRQNGEPRRILKMFALVSSSFLDKTMNNHKSHCQLSARGWAASIPPECTCNASVGRGGGGTYNPPNKTEVKCGETHSACNKRIRKEGGKTRCCYCVPHSHCEFFSPKPEERKCKEPNHSAGLHDVSCPDWKKPEYNLEEIEKAAKKTKLYRDAHPEESPSPTEPEKGCCEKCTYLIGGLMHGNREVCSNSSCSCHSLKEEVGCKKCGEIFKDGGTIYFSNDGNHTHSSPSKGSWEEKIKYIIAAPFLSPPLYNIPQFEVKKSMDWQKKEIESLIQNIRQEAYDEGANDGFIQARQGVGAQTRHDTLAEVEKIIDGMKKKFPLPPTPPEGLEGFKLSDREKEYLNKWADYDEVKNYHKGLTDLRSEIIKLSGKK